MFAALEPPAMSPTQRNNESLETAVAKRDPAWIVVARPGRESPPRDITRPGEEAPTNDQYLRQLSRNVECLRAACATAGPMRQWWVRRQLRVLEKEKAKLEQCWRRW